MMRLVRVAAACAFFVAATFPMAAFSKGAGFYGKTKFSFGNSKSFFRSPKLGFTKFPAPTTPNQPAPPSQPAPPAVSNVMSFGATGNGTTDDTAAIQRAVTDAVANNRAVFFPAGTYLHTSTLTFTGVSVVGAGNATVLLAKDPMNAAIILSGVRPSLQNLTISTASITGPGNFSLIGKAANVLALNAAEFSVSSCTLAQGTGRVGVYVTNTVGGTVVSSAFNGTGSSGDHGVYVNGASFINVQSNLFQNQDVGIEIEPVGPGQPSQSIYIASNTIGNVQYPIITAGIFDNGNTNLAIQSNVIQMANSTSNGMQLGGETNLVVTANRTFGGAHGITVLIPPGPCVISQNTISNAGTSGLQLLTQNATTGTSVTANTFGECGLVASSPESVIQVAGLVPNDPNGLAITNNVYAGHINHLQFFIQSSVHINSVNGNTQTQTALSNQIP